MRSVPKRAERAGDCSAAESERVVIPVATRLRDGVVKRGDSWSYVVRVMNPATGRSRPKWVAGFSTEKEAKAARDDARVAARRGEYVDRSPVTVKEFLADWLEAHAVEVKPKTLHGYRHDVERYVVPHLGDVTLQSLQPARLTRFYRDLLEKGGQDGRPLSARSVDRVHRTLRKALNDAVHVERLLTTNPSTRAKRPAVRRGEPGGALDAEPTEEVSRRRGRTPVGHVLPDGRLHRRSPW